MSSRGERPQDAEKILPKPLLRKLQRYCSGLVYIPRRRTLAQSHRDQVRILHNQGLSPAEIASRTTLSVKHIKRIIKHLTDDVMPEPSAEHRIYASVPEDVVEIIQRYVEGSVYVPPSTSKVARKHAHVKRLLRDGHTTAEVAARTGMSERRIWQLKAEYAEEITRPKQTSKRQPMPDIPIPDSSSVTIIDDTTTPPRVCRLCGNLLEPYENSCVMCSSRQAKEEGDPDIIVVSKLPFAVIDRNF